MPKEIESAADRARRLWDGDAHTTARALLKDLLGEPEPVQAIMVLLPWITDRVRAAIRTDVRHAEQAAWEDPSGHVQHRVATAFRTQRGPLPALDNMELLLQLPVLVPRDGDVQAVPWKDMTIADHQARIGMLLRPRRSVEEAVSRHQWAIAEISKYGVNCLGDIDVAVLKADLPAA